MELDGWAAGHGFALDEMRVDRFCNFVWWKVTEGAEQAEVDKFHTRLWRPPVGMTGPIKSGPWSAEAEKNAFSAVKAMLGQ